MDCIKAGGKIMPDRDPIGSSFGGLLLVAFVVVACIVIVAVLR